MASTLEEAVALADLRVDMSKNKCNPKGLGVYFGDCIEDVLKTNGKYVVEFIMDKDHGVKPVPKTTSGEFVPGKNMAIEYRFKCTNLLRLERCITKVDIKLRDGTVVESVKWR